MAIPKFKVDMVAKLAERSGGDKYAEALRIVDANLSAKADETKIKNLKASINGMKEEEELGEITSEEATRNLENLIKMYRGGKSKKRRLNKKKTHRRRR
jgi:tellurite resistance protein